MAPPQNGQYETFSKCAPELSVGFGSIWRETETNKVHFKQKNAWRDLKIDISLKQPSLKIMNV